jgi:hypothetical protein
VCGVHERTVAGLLLGTDRVKTCRFALLLRSFVHERNFRLVIQFISGSKVKCGRRRELR